MTTFDNDSGARKHMFEIFIHYHLLDKDPFLVPPFNVFMIMRELRGAFRLLLGSWMGPCLLRYLQEQLDRAEFSS